MEINSKFLEQINAQTQGTLMGNLGMTYTVVSPERVEVTMPVDARTRQPFGLLHGGASLALAETVAGLGSLLLIKDDETMVGMQVSGNHVASALDGETVTGIGTLVHGGRTTHVWNVDVVSSSGKLVSSIRVVNCVRPKR